MKSVLNMTGLFAGMILGVLFLRPLSADGAGDPAKGKAIYEKHCMACHGPQGKGDGPTGKNAQASSGRLFQRGEQKEI